VPVDPAEITVSAGATLWGIYYLNETTGEWLYFIPGFEGSTLTQLEPDKFYLVVVSDACSLTIPQLAIACLASGTIIDTPNGPVPVEQLQPGMLAWTMDESGRRVAARLVETSETPVPPNHQVVSVTLNDGRQVTASLGHPTAEGRALGDYCVGDVIDGSIVIDTDYMTYGDSATYDILPDGSTGLYWANGILLKSTLTSR
jgi:hypothetical protein